MRRNPSINPDVRVFIEADRVVRDLSNVSKGEAEDPSNRQSVVANGLAPLIHAAVVTRAANWEASVTNLGAPEQSIDELYANVQGALQRVKLEDQPGMVAEGADDERTKGAHERLDAELIRLADSGHFRILDKTVEVAFPQIAAEVQTTRSLLGPWAIPSGDLYRDHSFAQRTRIETGAPTAELPSISVEPVQVALRGLEGAIESTRPTREGVRISRVGLMFEYLQSNVGKRVTTQEIATVVYAQDLQAGLPFDVAVSRTHAMMHEQISQLDGRRFQNAGLKVTKVVETVVGETGQGDSRRRRGTKRAFYTAELVDSTEVNAQPTDLEIEPATNGVDTDSHPGNTAARNGNGKLKRRPRTLSPNASPEEARQYRVDIMASKIHDGYTEITASDLSIAPAHWESIFAAAASRVVAELLEDDILFEDKKRISDIASASETFKLQQIEDAVKDAASRDTDLIKRGIDHGNIAETEITMYELVSSILLGDNRDKLSFGTQQLRAKRAVYRVIQAAQDGRHAIEAAAKNGR